PKAFVAVAGERCRRHLVDPIVLPGDELLTGRADTADEAERRPVLARPVRTVRAVDHVRHPLAHGGRGVGGEEVGGNPRHVDVAGGGGSWGVHGSGGNPAGGLLTCLAVFGVVAAHSPP